jgi:hypothetical protein
MSFSGVRANLKRVYYEFGFASRADVRWTGESHGSLSNGKKLFADMLH